jgi:hypothetical protein
VIIFVFFPVFYRLDSTELGALLSTTQKQLAKEGTQQRVGGGEQTQRKMLRKE